MRTKLGFGWDSKADVETAERLMVSRCKRNIFITAAIFIVLAFPVIFILGSILKAESDMAALVLAKWPAKHHHLFISILALRF